MKELLKTSLLWIVIICALPVLLCARKVTALGESTAEPSKSGYDIPADMSDGLPVFSLESDLILSVYGFEADGITDMDIEEYVYRAVLAEIPKDMEYEALKAQAAAARTYAVRRLLAGEEEVCEGIYAHIACDPEKYQTVLTDREISLLYGGIDGDIPQKARQAAADTAGEIIVYNGSPIIAAFHTANGGMTESGENVWVDVFGGSGEPYLSPVESEGDLHSEYYDAEYIFTDREIIARISAEFDSSGDLDGEYTGVNILSATPSGNVQMLEVCGAEISGEKFAEIFSLPSRNFSVVQGGGTTTVITRGSGHMAGMSMYGADYMAKCGADYREILLHYYKGAEIGKLRINQETAVPSEYISSLIGTASGFGGTVIFEHKNSVKRTFSTD
ncbi:MAG: SpoIID/LytB domain-containing protein [Oscillospiraceae bacterium]|nr:SpoIID/LytB domain-containing protein [Oscillospiraceae bacterium]